MSYVRTIVDPPGTYLREQSNGWWKLRIPTTARETIEVLLPAEFFDTLFDRKETK